MPRVLTVVLYSLPYLFVFVASLYLPKDPDLGWHLKYGEYFFQHGRILKENIFSTQMVGYVWPNGSWGTDILTYAFYHLGGFTALIVASALMVTMTFFVFAKAARFTFVEQAIFFPLFIYLQSGLNSHSFRGQQISMLLLAVLIFLLSRYKFPSKMLWFVPLFFFIWINVQAESFLGIAVFGLWIGCVMFYNVLKKKKIFTKEHFFLLKVFFVTFVITFLNPFGWGVHLIALAHVKDPFLQAVTDYTPFSLFSSFWWNQVVVLCVIIGCALYLLFKKKLLVNFPWVIIPLVLILLSFDVRRYTWPAYYTLFPLLLFLWEPIGNKLKSYRFIIASIILLVSFWYVIPLKQPFSQFIQMSWQTFCEERMPRCTDASAQYLQDHGLTKGLLSHYDWGGWLIWNYPQVKPNIDGRMHIWKDENGYRPFAEQLTYLTGISNIDESSYDVVYFPMEREMPLYQRVDALVREGKWKLVYEDGYAGIVVRVK